MTTGNVCKKRDHPDRDNIWKKKTKKKNYL